MELQNKLWRVPETNPNQVAQLSARLGVSLITAKILLNRGLDAVSAREFLSPALSGLHDPLLMPDMEKALDRLLRAKAAKEPVVVYGDYDVDGITSCALLVRVMRSLGFQVDYYIPNRLEEGYGLNAEAIRALHSRGSGLIVTVDCGISAVAEVQLANELGLDVIVTDHHQPGDILPPALAVLNPSRRDSTYPFSSLAGVGVAFKLTQALLGSFGLDGSKDYLDLVALGTIADVVPLFEENRIIAKFGLERLADTNLVGLRALLEVTSLEGRELTAGHVGFVLAPRINALGRIADPSLGVRLLLSDRMEEALPVAKEMDARNRERQALEASVLEEALQAIEEDGLQDDLVLVIAREGWHHGVIGIVASRIAERYHRPVIMIGLEGTIGRGSCRSIPEFNIYEALCQCADDLLGFGGHPVAAGISITGERIPEFRCHINKVAQKVLSPEDLMPKIEADAWVELRSITPSLVAELDMLAPFGPGNPVPVLACRGVKLPEYRGVGRDGSHLKLVVCDSNGCRLGAIGWRMAELLPSLSQYETMNIAFSPSINEWNGKRSVQLEIHDLQADPVSRYAALTSKLREGWLPGFKKLLLQWAEREEDINRKKDRIPSVSGGTGFDTRIIDHRGENRKNHYLMELVRSTPEDTVVIAVNQPLEAVRLAFLLASELRETERRVTYCHPGLEEEEFSSLAEMMDAGWLRALVWAGGDLPRKRSTRQAVFFALPISSSVFAEFVSTFRPVHLHLLFGPEDIPVAHAWLEALYPDRDRLARVYTEMVAFMRGRQCPVEEILRTLGTGNSDRSWQVTAARAIRIFRELGLLQTKGVHPRNTKGWREGPSPYYEIVAPDGKLDLTNSISYNEGMGIRQEFLRFSEVVLHQEEAGWPEFLKAGNG